MKAEERGLALTAMDVSFLTEFIPITGGASEAGVLGDLRTQRFVHYLLESLEKGQGAEGDDFLLRETLGHTFGLDAPQGSGSPAVITPSSF